MHDSHEMRLNEMVRAYGCEGIVFCVYCHIFKKQRAFDTLI